MVWIALIGGVAIGFMMGVVAMCFMVNLGIKHTREENGENESR